VQTGKVALDEAFVTRSQSMETRLNSFFFSRISHFLLTVDEIWRKEKSLKFVNGDQLSDFEQKMAKINVMNIYSA
jgi:hypothetical protein